MIMLILFHFIEKNSNYLSIQWYGLNMTDFIDFLKNNNWSTNFINYYESNKNKLLLIIKFKKNLIKIN